MATLDNIQARLQDFEGAAAVAQKPTASRPSFRLGDVRKFSRPPPLSRKGAQVHPVAAVAFRTVSRQRTDTPVHALLRIPKRKPDTPVRTLQRRAPLQRFRHCAPMAADPGPLLRSLNDRTNAASDVIFQLDARAATLESGELVSDCSFSSNPHGTAILSFTPAAQDAETEAVTPASIDLMLLDPSATPISVLHVDSTGVTVSPYLTVDGLDVAGVGDVASKFGAVNGQITGLIAGQTVNAVADALSEAVRLSGFDPLKFLPFKTPPPLDPSYEIGPEFAESFDHVNMWEDLAGGAAQIGPAGEFINSAGDAVSRAFAFFKTAGRTSLGMSVRPLIVPIGDAIADAPLSVADAGDAPTAFRSVSRSINTVEDDNPLCVELGTNASVYYDGSIRCVNLEAATVNGLVNGRRRWAPSVPIPALCTRRERHLTPHVRILQQRDTTKRPPPRHLERSDVRDVKRLRETVFALAGKKRIGSVIAPMERARAVRRRVASAAFPPNRDTGKAFAQATVKRATSTARRTGVTPVPNRDTGKKFAQTSLRSATTTARRVRPVVPPLRRSSASAVTTSNPSFTGTATCVNLTASGVISGPTIYTTGSGGNLGGYGFGGVGSNIYAHYLSASGATKSWIGGTAVSYGGVSSTAIRTRVNAGDTRGIIFENTSEQGLFAVTGSSGNATLKGNMSVGGTLGVTGAATLSSSLDVTNSVTSGGNLTVSGGSVVVNDSLVGGILTVNNNATVGGTLSVTGSVTVGSLVSLGQVSATGIRSRPGVSGTPGGNSVNFYWNGSSLEAWVDNTKVGTLSDTNVAWVNTWNTSHWTNPIVNNLSIGSSSQDNIILGGNFTARTAYITLTITGTCYVNTGKVRITPKLRVGSSGTTFQLGLSGSTDVACNSYNDSTALFVEHCFSVTPGSVYCPVFNYLGVAAGSMYAYVNTIHVTHMNGFG